jgi:hypothetical protein
LRRGETNRHQAMPLRSDVAPQTCLRHDSRACGKERKGWGAEISWSTPGSGPRGGSAAVDKRQMDDRFAAHKERILRLNSKRLYCAAGGESRQRQSPARGISVACWVGLPSLRPQDVRMGFLFRRDYSLTRGKRGSVSFQVERIQTCWGSSVTANARAEPARKFR